MNKIFGQVNISLRKATTECWPDVAACEETIQKVEFSEKVTQEFLS